MSIYSEPQWHATFATGVQCIVKTFDCGYNFYLWFHRFQAASHSCLCIDMKRSLLLRQCVWKETVEPGGEHMYVRSNRWQPSKRSRWTNQTQPDAAVKHIAFHTGSLGFSPHTITTSMYACFFSASVYRWYLFGSFGSLVWHSTNPCRTNIFKWSSSVRINESPLWDECNCFYALCSVNRNGKSLFCFGSSSAIFG